MKTFKDKKPSRYSKYRSDGSDVHLLKLKYSTVSQNEKTEDQTWNWDINKAGLTSLDVFELSLGLVSLLRQSVALWEQTTGQTVRSCFTTNKAPRSSIPTDRVTPWDTGSYGQQEVPLAFSSATLQHGETNHQVFKKRKTVIQNHGIFYLGMKRT